LLWAVAGNAKAATQKSAAAQLEKRIVLLGVFMSEPRMVKGCLMVVRLDLLKVSMRAS